MSLQTLCLGPCVFFNSKMGVPSSCPSLYIPMKWVAIPNFRVDYPNGIRTAETLIWSDTSQIHYIFWVYSEYIPRIFHPHSQYSEFTRMKILGILGWSTNIPSIFPIFQRIFHPHQIAQGPKEPAAPRILKVRDRQGQRGDFWVTGGYMKKTMLIDVSTK